jgi:HEAT repeat protein
MELVRTEIEGRDYAIRLGAITAMGQVGDADAATHLEPRLADPDPMTRLTTAIAIDRILSR